MIIPTAVNIKAKFPEFADVADASVEFAIEDAARSVDDGWLLNDQTSAIMWLTAHYLMVIVQTQESDAGQIVQSEKIGPLSIAYKTRDQPVQAVWSDYTTTTYGTRFKELLMKSNPAIAII